MIRRAISPRFATSSDSIMPTLLWITCVRLWKTGSAGGYFGQRRERGRPEQGRPPSLVNLATHEGRRVHQAEGAVDEHPRLVGVELGPQRRQRGDPLLHVQPLKAPNLSPWLLGDPVELMQLQRDDLGVVEREVDVKVDERGQC